MRKITIKEYGLFEWYRYKLENDLLFKVIHTSILSAITTIITVILLEV